MTSDMAFEGLVVSTDPGVVCAMERVLEDFSIAVDVCVRPSIAVEKVSERNVDLVVVDWDGNSMAGEIVRKVAKFARVPKPTIIAIIGASTPVDEVTGAGANLVLQKPFTTEAGAKSIKVAYSRMMRNYRRYARHAIMKVVTATREGGNGEYFPVTVMDISEGGVGLLTNEKLTADHVLRFPLTLSGTEKTVHLRARVLWTKAPGMAGAQFMEMEFGDLRVLYRWLLRKMPARKTLAN